MTGHRCAAGGGTNPNGPGLLNMGRTICILVSAGTVLPIVAVHAQGISNARDRNGNLVERGAATRTYPSVPMANSAVVRSAPQGYVVIAHGRTMVIRR
jgi:hypothetical protein